MSSSEPLAGFAGCHEVLEWRQNSDRPMATDCLVLGDSRHVLPSLSSNSVDLVHTSPPYNIDKHYASTEDDLEPDDYLRLLIDVLSECYRGLRPGGSLFLQTGYSQNSSAEIIPIDMLSYDALRKIGFRLWDRIIWSYRGGMAFTRKFKNTHETILWWVKPTSTGSFQPTFHVDAVREQSLSHDRRNNLIGKNPGNVWSEDRVAFGGHARDTTHIAMYPEAITERIIRACTHAGDVVLDPFAGSGTTPAMARALGRRWIGVEVSATYVAEAQNRIGRKQASEVASLASGLVKWLGFANRIGRKSVSYLADSLQVWMDGFDSDYYARIQRKYLDCVFTGEPFASPEHKSRKPRAWRYFDTFLGGASHNEHLFLASALLDAVYPQRRQWNNVRKFLDARSITEQLAVLLQQEQAGSLVKRIALGEPSSFKLSEDACAVEFSGPPLRLRDRSQAVCRDPVPEPSQTVIFGGQSSP